MDMDGDQSVNKDEDDDGEPEQDFISPPNYGWKVKFNHRFTEKRNQNIVPRINQLPQFVGLGIRYLPWYIRLRLNHKKPVMDGVKTLGLQQIYGVPLGGLGGGTIGRGFRGEFCRFQLFPGQYQHHVVKEDVFIVCIRKGGATVYQRVLSTRKRRPRRRLRAWDWGGFPEEDADYVALFPRSWTTYRLREIGVTLTCRQVSPVIPHDYRESTVPAAVFVWHATNDTNDELEVSVALAFKNGTGSQKGDSGGGRWNEPFCAAAAAAGRGGSVGEGVAAVAAHGVMMHQRIRNTDCTVAVSALRGPKVSVSHVTAFDPHANGRKLWEDLWEDGALSGSNERSRATRKGESIACCVCAKTTVPAHSRSSPLKMCIAWDMPKFSFPAHMQLLFTHRYTRWFGSDGRAAPKLSVHALQHHSDWEKRIHKWQKTTLQNRDYPDWYKSAVFNELYFVSDGGSVWVDNLDTKMGGSGGGGMKRHAAREGDPREEYGKFGYLEGHEYRMFNTYDVHFYASFAIVQLWPKLQISMQYDMADAVQHEDLEQIRYMMSGARRPRKTANAVPHDIGEPEDCPWVNLNGYNVHDTATWRDLNLKFVLQVYRDFVFTGDKSYLKDMWPVVKALMEKCRTWDKDGDGLIENSGSADQTYDTWVMTGPSAYCGGLWLASIFCASKMAKLLGLDSPDSWYVEVLQKGRRSFEEALWTGSYYRFDGGRRSWSECVMTDQLCGQWYLRASGHQHEVFPRDRVHTALRTIYERNVRGFKGGRMGAVNSTRPDGSLDTCTIQAEEVWIGVTYSLAALMIHEGLVKEGFSTAEGVYRSVYDELGMAFQTPEALHPEKHYRSLGYMRPLCIWAIQWALLKSNESHIKH